MRHIRYIKVYECKANGLNDIECIALDGSVYWMEDALFGVEISSYTTFTLRDDSRFALVPIDVCLNHLAIQDVIAA